MNNICSVHKKLQAVAYCGECDMMLCVECFSNHSHISMNIKQYNDIHQILMDSSRSVYISALLNLALVTLKQQIEEKVNAFNDNHCTNEKKAISLIQSLKLESHKLYLENIKKRICYKIDSRISEHIVKSVTKIVDTICNTNYGQMPLEGYMNDETPQEKPNSPPKKANVVTKSQQSGLILDELLKAKTTKEINLSHKQVDDLSIANATTTLKELTGITLFNVNQNKLGKAGADKLALILQDYTKLSKLYLSSNGIATEGAISIISSIKSKKTITELDLSYNNILSDGAMALVDVVKGWPDLQELNLFCNGIGKAAAIAITEALASNKKLKRYWIGSNDLDDETKDGLRKYMKTVHPKAEFYV